LRVTPGGMTRTEIRAFVGGRWEAARIESALTLLRASGFAYVSYEGRTGGRPVERWLAT
jgi:hypothetical protein